METAQLPVHQVMCITEQDFRSCRTARLRGTDKRSLGGGVAEKNQSAYPDVWPPCPDSKKPIPGIHGSFGGHRRAQCNRHSRWRTRTPNPICLRLLIRNDRALSALCSRRQQHRHRIAMMAMTITIQSKENFWLRVMIVFPCALKSTSARGVASLTYHKHCHTVRPTSDAAAILIALHRSCFVAFIPGFRG